LRHTYPSDLSPFTSYFSLVTSRFSGLLAQALLYLLLQWFVAFSARFRNTANLETLNLSTQPLSSFNLWPVRNRRFTSHGVIFQLKWSRELQ
jgi:hypothetical protein